jgi:hypothetical protein
VGRASRRMQARCGSAIRVQAPEKVQQAGSIGGGHFGELYAESAPFLGEADDSLHADFSFMKREQHFDHSSDRHGVAHGNEHAARAQIADARYDAWPAGRPRDPYSLGNRNTSVAAVIFGDHFRHLLVLTSEGTMTRLNEAGPSPERNAQFCMRPSFTTGAPGRVSGARRPQSTQAAYDSALVYRAEGKIKGLYVEWYRRQQEEAHDRDRYIFTHVYQGGDWESDAGGISGALSKAFWRVQLVRDLQLTYWFDRTRLHSVSSIPRSGFRTPPGAAFEF